jgi:hypothetical protein
MSQHSLRLPKALLRSDLYIRALFDIIIALHLSYSQHVPFLHKHLLWWAFQTLSQIYCLHLGWAPGPQSCRTYPQAHYPRVSWDHLENHFLSLSPVRLPHQLPRMMKIQLTLALVLTPRPAQLLTLLPRLGRHTVSRLILAHYPIYHRILVHLSTRA